MAKNHTEKTPYQSLYSPSTWVTPAQFIAELICEKLAKRKKQDLPNKFWELPEWKKTFLQQVFAANSLLKIYSDKAIINALRSKDTSNIYSLRAPQLDGIIEREERRLKSIKTETKKVPHIKTDQKPRPTFSKDGGKLGRLRDLDG